MGFFSIADTQHDNAAVNNQDEGARSVTDPEAFQRIVLHAFGLQPIYREVFLLCDVQECTIAEAAEILNISPKAVSARLLRARRAVSARIGVGT
jgi:DNA-directed RNA polymerase specialized sigma24 family protein